MGAWVVPILRLYPHDAELTVSSGDDATGCRYSPPKAMRYSPPKAMRSGVTS
jgi:hypothetical protein